MHAPLMASLIAFVSGTVMLAVVAAGTGSLRRARLRLSKRRLAAAGPIPRWHLLGGLGGAFLVATSAFATPRIGLAYVFVVIVLGQTAGSLGVDAAGLGPSGRHPLTPTRITGTVICLAAVALEASGAGGELAPGLFLLVVLAGIGVSLQQAANGQFGADSGESLVAALVSFAGGLIVLALVVAVVAIAGGFDGARLAGPWWLWLAGLGGSTYLVICATAVRTLGVLRLSLAAIAGQLLAAVIFDAAAPSGGNGLRGTTIVAVLLTLVAVAVTGWPTGEEGTA
jgi:transporter family-2 protein